MKKHILSILAENHFGVLARITSMFSARGYNIQSVTASKTNDPEISNLTVVMIGDSNQLEQVSKQLNKLIEVLKVVDITEIANVTRELALFQVSTSKGRSEVIEICDICKAEIVDIKKNSLSISFTGTVEQVDNLMELLSSYGIKKVVRSGLVAMSIE